MAPACAFGTLGKRSGTICTIAPSGSLIVKSGDVARFHPDAAVAGRATDCLLLRRAMDVNAATERRARFALQVRAAK